MALTSIVPEGSQASARDTAPDGPSAVGPQTATVSDTWPRATSFDALATMVNDPAGPRDIALAPGTYTGDLIIKRAVALHGTKGVTLEGTGTGTVVLVQASDVTIENVVVRRSGHRHTSEDAGIKATGERVHLSNVTVTDTLFGIALEQCKACSIDRAHVVGYPDEAELRGDGVKLWESHDSTVRDCLIESARDLVVWYTRRATLEGNVVRRGRYGTHFMYAHDAVVRRSRLEGNVVGIFVMYSKRLTLEDNVVAGARGAAGLGLGFKDSDAVTVRGNWLVANTAGTYLDNSPRTPQEPVVFSGNVIALNDVALRLHNSERGLSFRGNDFRQNALMAEVDGGGNALAVDLGGNYYSDYQGYDLNGDGVGDVAYEVKALSSDLTDKRPSLKYFRGTAAMGLVDAVAHAVPVMAARTILKDAAPLMQRPGRSAP